MFATRNVSGGAVSDIQIAPLGQDFSVVSSDPISLARKTCAEILAKMESLLAVEGDRTIIYSSPEAASQPWIHAENVTQEGRRATVDVRFETRPFCEFPVILSVTFNDGLCSKHYSSIYELDEESIKRLCSVLMSPGPRIKLNPRRLREFPWQLLRRKQRIPLLESPIISSSRQAFWWAVAICGFMLVAAHPVMLLIIIPILVALYWTRRPVFRVTAGRATVEPRLLLRLDSWQTVVSELRDYQATAKTRIESELRKAFENNASDDMHLGHPISINEERIWYVGVDGKSERAQLVVRMRRATVFVNIHEYGEHLFVGWDAHLLVQHPFCNFPER